ncbi:MAG: ribitol-5-phosphate dehydrogenase [Ruminococcaceae bacterium]|nr:ribitol-5-phosphate dehydrogenase [Oscillospiraceae bacterium]
MIGRIYRLMDAKRIEMVQRELKFNENDLILKPDYLSICAADQRYYFGNRPPEILSEKLPMALIHEATATVLYDGKGELSRGSKVVIVPLIENESTEKIKANYNPENKFSSSGVDGFMQDLISVPHSRVIPIEKDYSVEYVFTELVSVVVNAIEAFEKAKVRDVETIGVWGDGNMGVVVSLVLRCLYPNAKIFVLGKSFRKLQHFPFVDGVYLIDKLPINFTVDHCFECVGGKNSDIAIQQILNVIEPQGCVSLLGVSENPVAISTRTVLDKGLILIGNSRSTVADMQKAVKLISENSVCRKYLRMLISETITIKKETDMMHAFEQSILNDFKTVMKWEV